MKLSVKEIEKRVDDSYELANNVIEAVPNPLVTIRTSTYQHGPYIKQCIEGILMQKTNFPFEFIIGEDFSTDGTREIVFEYARKYPDIIRVFTADYNVGSKANGKRCINGARGKYMALCEGDDYWIDPYKLQKQVDFLEKNKNCSLVFTGSEVHRHSGKISVHTYKNLKILNPTNYLNNAYFMPTNSLMFKKSIYVNYTYDWMFKSFAGDFILKYCALIKGDFGFIPDITCVYNKGVPGSWQKRKLSKKIILKEYSDCLRGLFFLDRHLNIDSNLLKEKIKKIKYTVYFSEAKRRGGFKGVIYLFINLKYSPIRNVISYFVGLFR